MSKRQDFIAPSGNTRGKKGPPTKKKVRQLKERHDENFQRELEAARRKRYGLDE